MNKPYALSDQDSILDGDAFDGTFGKKYILKIKDMPSEDKPREKMSKYGPSALSAAELMAVLLGAGTKKEDIMSMSARIVREYGEHALFGRIDSKVLSEELGIPLQKSMQIVACAELGRRFFERQEHGLHIVRTAKDIYEYLIDIRNLPKEHLRGIYLNTHYRLIHDELISIGTINSNLIHPREVLKPAIEYGAAAFILAHNHPSNEVTPSQADIDVTKKIIAAGKLIGIPLLDHVIIGKSKFTSVDVEY